MRRLFFISLFFLGTLGLAPATHAVVLSPGPLVDAVETDDVIRVEVLVDSQGEAINAVETAVTYSSQLLELMAVDRGQTIMPLWIEEPQLDLARGRIKLVAGVANGVVTNGAPLATLVFRAKLTGTAIVSLDVQATDVRLNDGIGSPAAVTIRPLSIDIGYPNADTPNLLSPSHPSEARWSTLRDATIRWMPYRELFVSYRLSTNPADLPDEMAEANTGEVTFPALSDGIWYFTLQSRFAGKDWSPVARYQFLIDGTPPLTKVANLALEADSGHWLFSLIGEDSPAGITKTEIRIEQPNPRWWPWRFTGEWQAGVSPFDLGTQLPLGRLTGRLTDAAGNTTSVEFRLGSVQRQQLIILAGVLTMSLLLLVGVVQLTRHRRIRRQRRRQRL